MDIEFLTVFSVNSLKMSSYSILAFITSEKKPAVNFSEKSWYMMSLFSCYFQDFPFVFVFHQLDYKVSRCGSLWFIPLGVCWSSWMCILIFSSNLGSLQPLFVQIFLSFFSFSYPSGTLIIGMLVCFMMSYVSYVLFIFLHSFSFCFQTR